MSLGQNSGSSGYGGQQAPASSFGNYGGGQQTGIPGSAGPGLDHNGQPVGSQYQRYGGPQQPRQGQPQQQRRMPYTPGGAAQPAGGADPWANAGVKAAGQGPQSQQSQDQEALNQRASKFSSDFTKNYQQQHGQEGSASSPYNSQVMSYMSAGVPDSVQTGWLNDYVGSHGGNTYDAFARSHGGDQGAFQGQFDQWKQQNPNAQGGS